MTECVLCISIYTFGIKTMFSFKHKLLIPSQIYSRISVEYALLLLCCLARLSFNSMIYFVGLGSYEAAADCSNINFNTSYYRYWYMTLGYCLMHILPISTLLIIYWP